LNVIRLKLKFCRPWGLEGRRFDPALKRWLLSVVPSEQRKKQMAIPTSGEDAALIETRCMNYFFGGQGLRRSLFWNNKRQTITNASRTILPVILDLPRKRSVKMMGLRPLSGLAPDFVRHFNLKAVAVGADFIEIDGFQSAAAEALYPPVGSLSGMP